MEGQRIGHGSMTYVDGSRYEGEWAGNWRNGQGVYTLIDGQEFRGCFKDDIISKGKWSRNDNRAGPKPNSNSKKGKSRKLDL